MVKKLKAFEENGLILVEEAQQLEDGHLIISSYYTDAIDPHASGKRTYYASVMVLSDGTTNGELLITTFLSGVFEYDSETDYIHLVEGSKDGFSLKENSDEYPIILNKDNASDIDEIEYYDDFSERNTYALIYTTKALWSKDFYKTYTTNLTVDSTGRQIGSGLEYRKP